MTQRALLSVIVPVYNIEAYLADCVRSLLAQTYAPLEVLLVDDGATDGSGALCDALSGQHDCVRAFHQANAGQAAAKNRGISEAKGRYLAFVDGDDTIAPEMYERLIGVMEENGATVGECAFNYVFDDHAVHTGGDTGAVLLFPREKAICSMSRANPLMIESARKVYHRDAIGGARFPEGTLYEEVGFLRAISKNLGTVAYVDTPYYQYRQRRAGNTNSRFPAEKLAVLPECDAFVAELREEGLMDAANGMEAFTLDHIMRMYSNARACCAQPEILRALRRAFRERLRLEKANPYVRRLRALAFACSPAIYDRLSRCRSGRSI